MMLPLVGLVFSSTTGEISDTRSHGINIDLFERIEFIPHVIAADGTKVYRMVCHRMPPQAPDVRPLDPPTILVAEAERDRFTDLMCAVLPIMITEEANGQPG